MDDGDYDDAQQQRDAHEREQWEAEQMTNDCTLWEGPKAGSGYGVRSIKGRLYYVHRLAWESVNGPIPAGFVIAHRCDTPACHNPDHLFACTQADNLLDMRRKGRGNTGERHGSKTQPDSVARGERVGGSKLTESIVRAIRSERAAGRTLPELATKYGVAFQTISKVANRTSWRHV
jgi:hypothetical protein